MKILSGRLGQIEIDPAAILTFGDGVIGFPDYKRYVELGFLENSPLKLLQAVDTPDLGFIIIDPVLFAPDYRVEITGEDLESLGASDPSELVTRAIVTIPRDPYEMTANLQGPLLINPRTRLARQLVNHNQDYTTKHRILHGKDAPSAA